MLKNDPPPGTKLKFVRQVQKAARHDPAVLVRALRKYETESPNDLFEVTYKGTNMIVERQDIQKQEAQQGSSL
jgi:hypothetical protein